MCVVNKPDSIYGKKVISQKGKLQILDIFTQKKNLKNCAWRNVVGKLRRNGMQTFIILISYPLGFFLKIAWEVKKSLVLWFLEGCILLMIVDI